MVQVKVRGRCGHVERHRGAVVLEATDVAGAAVTRVLGLDAVALAGDGAVLGLGATGGRVDDLHVVEVDVAVVPLLVDVPDAGDPGRQGDPRGVRAPRLPVGERRQQDLLALVTDVEAHLLGLVRLRVRAVGVADLQVVGARLGAADLDSGGRATDWMPSTKPDPV